MKVAWCSDHIRACIFARYETEFGGATRSQFHGREARLLASPLPATEVQVINQQISK